ncbi:16S rRNA (cytidine(1402)-2'-O)-methyltransferase [Gammaproteobacteria bacterium]|nr:16S rRNA (cytidine(1402)-2'-O)-methyltransferase [Gammaproteobacteria bacterium]
MSVNDHGILYIISTPVGNLKDITFRAVEILKSVDLIAAEDTRHSMSLFNHYGIEKQVISLHEHNEKKRLSLILDKIIQGESVALVSDAGTPLINDPGYYLVKKAIDEGVKVVPIPGACALIAALSVSGLATNKFSFEGFLSHKSKKRKNEFTLLLNESRTMIFYESPHRILDFLEDMKEIFGIDRKVVVARELTKKFETVHRGLLGDLINIINADPNQVRGEFVVLVEGGEVKSNDDFGVEKMINIFLGYLSLKESVEVATKITNKNKNEIYNLALQIKNKNNI